MGFFSRLGKSRKLSVSKPAGADPVAAPSPESDTDPSCTLELYSQFLAAGDCVPEPRLSKDELEKGRAEICGRVAAEMDCSSGVFMTSEPSCLGSYVIGNTPKGRSSLASSGGYDYVASMVESEKSFGRLLARYVNERCEGKASICYQRAGVSRQLYSRIISDINKSVSRRTAMQLCIGLKLSISQAREFLSYAGYSFSRASFEDTAFEWCIENGKYSIFDINELLMLNGQEPIPVN